MNERSPGEESATIERAGQALIEAVPAPAKVILFGSRARGDGDDRSDYDFLVIECDVDDRFNEMVRLDRILGRMLIPAEVIVATEEEVRMMESVKGSLIYRAISEGRVIAES